MEQTSGIEQVNQAIAQMDDVTQQNAALVEQAAASAESLEEQAHNLSITVSSFKVDNNSRGIPINNQPSVKESTKGKLSSVQNRTDILKVAKPKLHVMPNSEEWEEF
jgi:methyl-accepting chemotaxis protein